MTDTPRPRMPREDAGDEADLTAVTRDDALLDALGRGFRLRPQSGPDGALTWDEEPLVPVPPIRSPKEPAPADLIAVLSLLGALRADVDEDLDASPAADPVLLPAVAERAALVQHRGRLRRFVPRSAAAGVSVGLVLAMSGVAAATVTAGPDSWLYPLHRAMADIWPDNGPTASQRAASEVRRALDAAGTALAQQDRPTASSALAQAAARLPLVSADDGAPWLRSRWRALSAQLAALGGAGFSAGTSPTGALAGRGTPAPAGTPLVAGGLGASRAGSPNSAAPITSPGAGGGSTHSQPPAAAGQPGHGGQPSHPTHPTHPVHPTPPSHGGHPTPPGHASQHPTPPGHSGAGHGGQGGQGGQGGNGGQGGHGHEPGSSAATPLHPGR